MKLAEAKLILNQVEGKSYEYMKQYGLSTIKEAIHTIRNRVKTTQSELYKADTISIRIKGGE